MSTLAFSGDPDSLSRPELVSLYINGYRKLDAGMRAKYEAAFRKRRLPLPDMSAEASPSHGRGLPSKECGIDRGAFLSYILLIYSGTAVFYCWVYLAQRLVKMDFGQNTKHKLIQTGISLLYAIGEIFLCDYFAHLAD